MAKVHNTLSKKVRQSFLIALALTVLLTPIGALAAQRDGTVLFFSFEDLKQGLVNLTPATLVPSFPWRDSQQQANQESQQESQIERNYRWGHGLGFDSYAYPGVRMPLWGY